MKAIEKLSSMIKENPDLPVIAMGNTDSFEDESFAYLVGAFCGPRVDEYVVGRYNEILLKSDYYDKYELLEKIYGTADCEDLSDEDIEKVYNELPWKKAITVYVE